MGESYIWEILGIYPFVVVQIDIIAWVTKEYDQKNIIEFVISARFGIVGE